MHGCDRKKWENIQKWFQNTELTQESKLSRLDTDKLFGTRVDGILSLESTIHTVVFVISKFGNKIPAHAKITFALFVILFAIELFSYKEETKKKIEVKNKWQRKYSIWLD